LGIRLVAALLTHRHDVIAFLRSANKVVAVLPASVYRQINIVEGDAKHFILHQERYLRGRWLCDAVLNAAGLAALPPWGNSELPAISQSVLNGVREAGLDRKKP